MVDTNLYRWELVLKPDGAGDLQVVEEPSPLWVIPSQQGQVGSFPLPRAQWLGTGQGAQPKGQYHYQLIVGSEEDLLPYGRIASDNKALLYFNGDLVATSSHHTKFTWFDLTEYTPLAGNNSFLVAVSNSSEGPTGLLVEFSATPEPPPPPPPPAGLIGWIRVTVSGHPQWVQTSHIQRFRSETTGGSILLFPKTSSSDLEWLLVDQTSLELIQLLRNAQ